MLPTDNNDTIFAAATAPIKSGVAIIRVSGDNAEKAITLLTGKKTPAPRYAALHKLYNPSSKELIDEAVILWFPAPASFTGENIAEFHIHGSRAVITQMLEVLSEIDGFRLAQPGEFSRRAFINGKMDLTEAEGLADLIDAETKIQARQALRQKQGELRILYDKWRKDLIAILANIEAYIDFPDEEIPQNLADKVAKAVSSLKNDLSRHLDDNKRGEKLRQGIYVTIIGSPNSGKSSLINCLVKRDVAIVSDIAGTTRDIIEVHLDLGGYPVILADTAGLRKNAGKIEKEGIKRALERSRQSDLKIAMFDASVFPDVDNATLKLVDENSLIVINKTDLLKDKKPPAKLQKLHPIMISVKEGRGVDKLLDKLQDYVEANMGISSDPVITRQRHRGLLLETIEHLDSFTIDKQIELAAEDLRFSTLSLGQITGHIDTEEILGEIFSNFCIGK